MTKNTEHLKLWDSVKTPDPKYTKSVKMRGGFTATSPQYLIRVATEQFGPYGFGFGLCESEFDYQLVSEFRMAIHKAKFFYVLNGSRSEFPITNTVEIVSKNGHVDTDYAKKAETNTLCKALSKIGFAADVYMGMFDDNDYVMGAAAKADLEKMDEQEESSKKAYDEIAAWCKEQAESAKSLSKIESFNKAIDRIKEKVAIRCGVAGFSSIGFETRLDEIKLERNNDK